MAEVVVRKRPMLRWITLVCVLIAVPVAYVVTQWTRQAILIDRADQMMYEAKQKGRDRVISQPVTVKNAPR